MTAFPTNSHLPLRKLTLTAPGHSEEVAAMLAFTRNHSTNNGATVPISSRRSTWHGSTFAERAAPTKAHPAHTDFLIIKGVVLGSSGEIGHSGLSRDQILFSWLIL